MKVVIFGASGKTGTLLLEQALAKGYQVVAYNRRSRPNLIEHPNLKVIVGNLNETLKLKDAISGADACISALGGGSLTKHAREVMEGIDRIVSIMEEERVHRFIYLSSIGAGESRFLMPQPMRFFVVNILLRIPLADHNANEQRIIDSNLNWTIVRPGSLTNGPVTEKIEYGINKIMMTKNRSISRTNVAAFMLQQVADDTFQRKSVWLYE